MRKGGPIVDATVIGMLRERVIAHNSTPGNQAVKLNQLKQIFQRGWRGADPAARALSKVDEFLGTRLAKDAPFNESEHPRDGDGQFTGSGGGGSGPPPGAGGGRGQPPPEPPPRKPQTPKAPLGLPASPQAHQALMEGNAGYQAFQTAVIPETRYGTTGSIARDLGLLGLGVGTAVSLYRGKPNGLIARKWGAQAGVLGELAGGFTGAAGRGLRQAMVGGARRAFGKPLTDAEKAAERALTSAHIRGSAVRGGQIARRLAAASFKGSSKVVRSIADTAAGTGAPGHQAVRRAAAITAIGAGLAYPVRNAIMGTPIDPQVIGSTIDSYSARTVKKLAGDTALGDTHDAMLKVLFAGGDVGELRKAIPAGAYSRLGHGLLSAAGAAAGAIGGATAGTAALAAHRYATSGGKTGNPYHDKSGKFTSASQAQTTTRSLIGASLVGAAAAGAGVYLALKSHNTRVLGTLSRGIVEHANGLIHQIGSATGVDHVATMLQHQASTVAENIKNAVDRHPDVVAAERAAAQFGASNPLRYKAALIDHLHSKIAEQGAHQDNFLVPKLGTNASIAKDTKDWESIGELKQATIGAGRRKFSSTAAATRIHDFLAGANDAQFAHATQHLSTEQQTTARGLWDAVRSAPATIDKELAAHHGRIAEAAGALDTAKAALGRAEAAHADATAVHARAVVGSPEHATTLADLVAKAAARDTAKTAHTAAAAVHSQVHSGEPTIRSPLGERVHPPNADTTVADTRARVTAAATRAETRKFEKVVAKARSEQLAAAVETKNRQLGAQAVLQVRHGATSGGIGPSIRALSTAEHGVQTATAAFDQAAVTHAATTARMANLKAAIAGKVPKGLTPGTTADLLAGQARVTEEHAAATAALADAKGKLALARDASNNLVAPFEAALANPPASRFNLLPARVREDMSRDLAMARTAMSGVEQKLMAHPTAKAVVDFIKAIPGQANAARAKVWQQAFFTPNGDFSAFRAARSAIIAGGIYETGGKPLIDYAINRFSDKPTPFPRHLIKPEFKVDPITGAGYVTVSTPHPNDPNDRMVLWGEHAPNADAAPRSIQAGGSLAQVRTAFSQGKLSQQQQQARNGGGAGAPTAAGDVTMNAALKTKFDDAMAKVTKANELKTETAGPTDVTFREGNSPDGNVAAGAFIDHMRPAFLNTGQDVPNDKYWSALGAVVSKQGQALTPHQAWRMLSNQDEKYKNGVFAKSADLLTGSPDTVAKALHAEIARVAKLNPSAADVTNLHRAVQLSAKVKNLNAGQISGLHDQIKNISPAAASQPEAAASSRTGTAAFGTIDLRQVYDKPPSWPQQDYNTLSHQYGVRAAKAAEANYGGAHEAYTLAVGNFAKAVHKAYGFNIQSSFKVAHDTLIEAAKDQGATLNVGDGSFYARYLEQNANAHNETLTRSDDYNDLDALLEKAFNASEQRDPQGSQTGGQWTDGGAGAAPAQSPHPQTPVQPAHVPDYHPLRASQDLASNAGMQAAWNGAAKALKGGPAAVKAIVSSSIVGTADVGLARTIAAKTLGVAAQGATAVGTGGLKLAAGVAGGAAAVGLAQLGLHAAGYKLPGESEKPSFGRDIAGTVGSVVGGIAGGAAGITSGPGAFATAVGGSWAGQIAGQHIYDWFSPYGAQHTARATSRFTQKAA